MKTIKKPIQCEINVKKSQFICSLFPTKNKKESKDIIQKLNQQYNDATHNCTAYIVSDGEGFDDDGEPGGTAGKPMINVLRKNEIHNVTAVVTRYFGGIKLGAGGLVRAYSKSVMEALGEAEIVEIEEYDVFKLIFEYSDIQYRLCVSPASRVILIKYATYRMLIPLCTCKLFIAEDFTLNGKSTYLESVVKSSKIMVGNLLYIPVVSFVYPRINDFPGVRTGVLSSSLYSVDSTIYCVGCS